MILTIMYDNRPYRKGWESGWGFSAVADNGKERVLFDTGDNPYKLVSNFKKSDIDIRQISAITFSHKHWDHVDGLEGFLNINKTADICMPENFSKNILKLIIENGNKITDTGKEIKKLAEDIFVTPVFKKFFKPAEQGLVLKTIEGLVLVTGCAHPGILRMVKETNKLFNEKVKMILGGFHLSSKTDRKVKKIINNLKKEGVRYFAPSHCTGKEAIKSFKKECGDRYIKIGCGKRLDFNNLIL